MSEAESRALVLANFDPDAFLNFEYESATETKRQLTPAGWHEIYIESFELIRPKQFQNKQTGAMEWSSPIFKPKCVIEDEGVRTLMGVTDPERKLYVYPQLYLDVTETGAIDMGPNKNISLGQIRQACGQNNEGVRWRISDLAGSVKFFGNCRHETPDAAKPEAVYERWVRFVSADEHAAQPAAK
jgi:hypothetical protein